MNYAIKRAHLIQEQILITSMEMQFIYKTQVQTNLIILHKD